VSPLVFYERIVRAKCLVLPRGDRQDTYRHWEAIGLGALPIANINRMLYGSLFEGDMVYMDDTRDMARLLKDEGAQCTLTQQYHEPSAHRLSSLFWVRKVDDAKRACLKDYV
jgi:hypothetical protein